jgi:hypothetical protein
MEESKQQDRVSEDSCFEIMFYCNLFRLIKVSIVILIMVRMMNKSKK